MTFPRMGFSSGEEVPSKIGNRISSSQPTRMGQFRFGRSHRGIRGISWDYNDRSLPDSTRKVALRGFTGCSMPFYGVSGPEVERSWGSELDKNRMYFRSPLTLPSLLSHLVATRRPGTMRTPVLLTPD